MSYCVTLTGENLSNESVDFNKSLVLMPDEQSVSAANVHISLPYIMVT